MEFDGFLIAEKNCCTGLLLDYPWLFSALTYVRRVSLHATGTHYEVQLFKKQQKMHIFSECVCVCLLVVPIGIL